MIWLWAGLGTPVHAAPDEGPSPPGQILAALNETERAWLRDHPVITMANDPGWPPVEFTDERGEHAGMSADYLRLIEHRLGLKFKRVPDLSWQELIARHQRRELDLATCVAVTPPRLEYWAFTKPYLTVPVVIATRTDVPYIADLKELVGKKVALPEGYAVDHWITADWPGINLVRVPDAQAGLNLLQQGEVFAFIDSLLIIGDYQAKLKVTNIKIVGQTPYAYSLSMAVRKDWAPFVGILNQALDSISESERAEIYRKWLPLRYEHGFDYALFWKVLAVFAVIVLALVAWNRRLAQEIKNRQRAEAALRESEETFRKLYEDSPDPIALMQRDRFIQCNRATLRLFDITDERKLIGSPPMDFSPKRQPDGRLSAEAAQAYIAKAHAEGFCRFEWLCRTYAGVPLLVEVTLMPVGLRGQQLLHNTWRDITEQKRAEAEREQLQSQLNQAQKMEFVGRLAGGVAHDFNNMLAVILGHTEMSLNMTEPAAPLYASLQAVQHAAERSAALTQQLLAFARKQTVSPKVIDLNETVEGMLKMLRRLIGEDIDLIWHPGTNLKPIRVDPSQIDQLLANLCVNARDAIADVGKITIETDEKTFDEAYCSDHPGSLPGEYVLLNVSDDGCGMDQDLLNHIFEPFFTTKEQGKGTGLGLASVFGMVKQNNGFINVYSEPGQGTTFKIYLPAYAEKATQEPKKVPDLPTEHGHETVLLVEDELAILEMTTKMLSSLGYNVMVAASHGEAIRLAHEHHGRIDLLMTDVVMPGMNGRELGGSLLSHYPDLKLLFMSGYTANVIAHHGVLDEGVHFIQKPFSMKDLARKLREVLED